MNIIDFLESVTDYTGDEPIMVQLDEDGQTAKVAKIVEKEDYILLILEGAE